MPKPVRFNTLFFLLSLSLSSFCWCLGNKNGPLGVEIKEKKFSSSRRIFSRAVAMEKKSTETAFKARSDERFIVRRASIESFFSSAMSYSSSKGKFDFRGFLWFCNTLLVGLGFCSTVSPATPCSDFRIRICSRLVFSFSFFSLLLNEQKRQRFVPRRKTAGRNPTAWKNSARPSRKRSTSSRIL